MKARGYTPPLLLDPYQKVTVDYLVTGTPTVYAGQDAKKHAEAVREARTAQGYAEEARPHRRAALAWKIHEK